MFHTYIASFDFKTNYTSVQFVNEPAQICKLKA